MIITDDVKYIGVNDYSIDLFEGMYRVPDGISYNSYVILDEKVAVIDTVDNAFKEEWLSKLKKVLNGKTPDYLIVQHMEPDHSANIVHLLKEYPQTQVVASAKAFAMMQNYFGTAFEDNRFIVADGDKLCLGNHTLTFVSALMVHWPEVIMTYDSFDKILFSADGFGKFGVGHNDTEKPLTASEAWDTEARRYYFGIVGKYGDAVQQVLKKVKDLDIQIICSLHGPVLTRDIPYYVGKYDTWSAYKAEDEGIFIAYTSIYGNTRKAVELLAEKLQAKGCPKVEIRDLARCDLSEAVAETFRYPKLVLATTTYNTGIFPFMREYIQWLTERNFRNHLIAFMENGSWMPVATKLMQELFCKCKNIAFAENSVRILSALNTESEEQLEKLAEELCRDYQLKS